VTRLLDRLIPDWLRDWWWFRRLRADIQRNALDGIDDRRDLVIEARDQEQDR
jgi:hypothetical protein